MALAEKHKDPFEGWYQSADFVPADQREGITQKISATDISIKNRELMEFLLSIVFHLQDEQKKLKEKISSTIKEEFAFRRIEISSLGSEKLELTKNITVLLEVYEDEVIAKFIDAEVTGFGETDSEALDSLKNNIISLYFELIEDEDSLGPLPKKWLTVLREIIRQKK